MYLVILHSLVLFSVNFWLNDFYYIPNVHIQHKNLHFRALGEKYKVLNSAGFFGPIFSCGISSGLSFCPHLLVFLSSLFHL